MRALRGTSAGAVLEMEQPARRGHGTGGTVRCGVCGWRYELTRGGSEWHVVDEHPPLYTPGRPRLDGG